MDDTQKWYVMKQADGSIFGPIGFDVLRQWAVDAYIGPQDKVSNDSATWIKAPMVPELQMDYLLELSTDSYYGPTTVGAVREFLASGEIHDQTPVTNCKTGDTRPLCEFDIFRLPAQPDQGGPSVRENLQARIRELEEALVEERRLRQVSENLRARAEARLQELEGELP